MPSSKGDDNIDLLSKPVESKSERAEEKAENKERAEVATGIEDLIEKTRQNRAEKKASGRSGVTGWGENGGLSSADSLIGHINSVEKRTDGSVVLKVNSPIEVQREPGEKLKDFLQVATKRATDPEGWKAWAQSEIDKFSGVWEGLNEAKEEAKSAAVAGWNAMTDGSVVRFLSHPNAINEPLFKTVSKVFDAMGKDPNATNKALESLGNAIVKASDYYSNLPDHEKGKVWGHAMFAMINPDGSTDGAEAVLKIADKVAIHVDEVVINTIGETVKSIKEMAPEVAGNTKQMLYDYINSKGLTVSELERSGDIPKGLLKNLAGKGGDWNVLNERPSSDVLQQFHPKSCVSACGEMLTNGEFKQDHLIKRLLNYWPASMRQEQMGADLEWLAEELGPDWRGGYLKMADGSSEKKLGWLLNRNESFCAELNDGGPMGHAVIVDGINDAGHLCIRDPYDAVKYEMTRQEFLIYWTDRAVFRIQSEAK